MSINKRRLAGYRLAAVPIEDVSEQLRNAYDALTQRRGPTSRQVPGHLGGSFKVPGTGGAEVDLSARHTGASLPYVDEKDIIYGNPEQLQPILDPNTPGEYNLVWSVRGGPNDLSREQQVRIAREAARRWPSVIKQIPEGSIVSNSPVGAMSGDYERADLYTRFGFGPVQEDGQQFGVVRGGVIQPLSPFVAQKGHSSHLADRLAASGDLSLRDAISAELTRRKDTGIDERLAEAQGLRYSADDGDNGYFEDYLYSDDYYEQPPVTRTELKERITEAVAPVSNEYDRDYGRITSIPEIEARQAARAGLAYAPEGSYEPTGADIGALRDFQVQQLQNPSNPRDVVDFINDRYPRPLPSQITVDDLQQGGSRRRSSLLYGDDTPAVQLQGVPPEQRSQEAANILRDRLSSFATGYESDPSVLRNHLKQGMVSRTSNPTGLGVIAQENFSTQDLENFRTLQALQSGSFSVGAPMRTPPPTLNPDGTVASRRPAPPDAMDGSGVHLSHFNPYGFLDGQTVEWRRQLTPDQRAAANQIPAVAAAPDQIRNRITQLDDWLGGSTSSSQIVRDIYGVDSVQSLLNSERIDVNATPNLQRDLNILERGVTQPGALPRNRVAQAIYNLQRLEPQQAQLLQSLQDTVAPASYGPAAQVRRGPDTTLPTPEVDVLDLSQRRRAVRRPQRSSTLEGFMSRDTSTAPADMSMSEFLEWERQTDNVSSYALSPEERYAQSRSGRSSQDSLLQRAFDAPPLYPTYHDDPAPSVSAAQSVPSSARIPSGNTPGLSDLMDSDLLTSGTAGSLSNSLALERPRRPLERRRGSDYSSVPF